MMQATDFMHRVSVVIPALDEENTVGQVVAAIAAEQPGEIIVIDADSSDATAHRAKIAGAKVINWQDAAPGRGVPTQPGKGESLWRGVAEARGDYVVFVDADLVEPPAELVSRLARPLAEDSTKQLVKPIYRRGYQGADSGGGRVTELTAKPLLRLLFPHLAHIAQPLGGEYAIRRSAALTLPFVGGFGVEAGLLIDIAGAYGAAAITQVELGTRHHRNKPLAELAPMADVVAATILGRAEQYPCLGSDELGRTTEATHLKLNGAISALTQTQSLERQSLSDYGVC